MSLPSGPTPGVSTPTLLNYADVVTVNMDPSNDVNFADINDYGHRIQIPIGKSLFNLFFRWRREVGQDRPHAKITTSEVIEKTFKTVLVNSFNTSFTDIDGVTGGLHFGTANLSSNPDPRIRKDGLVSANDIPMAFIMHRLYGNSAHPTKNFIFNLEDAYDMLTSIDLAETIMNSFKTNEATSLDQMFRDLLSLDPKRFFSTSGVSDPNIFERSSDLAGEGSWKLAVNDIIEVRTKLIFHSKVTKRGVAGREHFLSDSNEADNQQNIIVPDDYFYVRLQLKVVDDGVVANPVNITYSDSTQTVVTGYTGTINGELILPEGVTSIAANAFRDQTGLTEVLIPQSVTTIGNEAFKNTGLVSVFMPKVLSIGDRSFQNCASLTTVIAPNLTTIGTDAFAGCIALVSINSYSVTEGFADVGATTTATITTQEIVNLDGVTSLGTGVFANCQSIETVIIPTTLAIIPAQLFSGAVSLANVTIPTSVTTIGSSAFSGTTSLTALVIPTSVTTIESNAFAGTGITSITLHSQITSIGQSVFENATALQEVVILAPITTLPAGIFNGASSLTTVELPPTIEVVAPEAFKGTAIVQIALPNVTTIQASAFANIATLETVTAPSVQVVSNTAFAGVVTLQEAPADPSSIVYSDSTNTVVTGYTGSVGTLKLPATVTAIADNAFLNNTNIIGITFAGPIQTIGKGAFKGSALRSINIPVGLTSIGSGAFQNCTNLTSVTLPTGPITLAMYCFEGCSALTNINITADITTIPAYCFNGCSNIVNLNIHSGITSIGDYAFNGCAKLASVTIPPAITTLGPYTFGGCAALTSITLPLTLTNYQTGCLSGCSGLTSITFPALTTTNIGDQVLANCTGLTSVTFPNKPPSGGAFPLTLGSGVLMGCTGLQSFTIPDQWLSLPNSFFEGSGLTSITVPSTITTLGTSLFKGCASLTTATIESAITTLPSATFQNCTALTSVTLPSTVTTIDTQAFRNSRITAFVNSVVTTIRDFAFADNPALVTLNAPNVTSLAISSISGASNLGDINVSALPSARVYFRAITYSGSGAWTNIGSLGSTHNATVAAGTPSKNTVGNGVVFNGSLRFSFPSVGSIPVYTQSVWIRRTTTARTIVGQQNWSSGNIGAGIHADNRRRFYGAFNRNNVWYSGGGTDVMAGQWSHLVVTWDGTNMTTYLNGSFVERTSWTGITHTENGINYNIGPDFVGELGEFRFYNIALNADQVQFLYIFTANSFPNIVNPAPELMVRFLASNFTNGSTTWANHTDLSSTYNATVQVGTPVKNAAGNGIVFTRGQRFGFPTIGVMQEHTVSAWIRRTGYSGNFLAQQNHWSQNSGFYTSHNNGRLFSGGFRTSEVNHSGGWVDTDLNRWYHIAFVFNGSTYFTYLNGGLVDRRSLPGRFVESTENQYFIGANWDGTAEFHGELNDLRIYKGALTTADIVSMYNSTVASYPSVIPTVNQLRLHFVASDFTNGSTTWLNRGDLGTANNAIVHAGTPVKNAAGNGVIFTRSQCFRIPTIGNFTQFTYSMWIKRTGYSHCYFAQQHHWSQNVGYNGGNNAGRLFWASFRTKEVDYTSGSVETDLNTWHHVTFVYTGSSFLTYSNGVLINTKPALGVNIEPTENQYFIGGNWSGTPELHAELGELRFYNYALNASQVSNIYSTTVSVYPDTTLANEMRIHFLASDFTNGTTTWLNKGSLGTTHNATVISGTPVKNTEGNGVVFDRATAFSFPTPRFMTRYTQSIWIKRTGISGNTIVQQNHWSQNVGPHIGHNNGRLYYGRFRTKDVSYGGAGVETDPLVWYNIVFVYDGSAMYSYRDGQLVNTTLLPGTFLELSENQYFIGPNWEGGHGGDSLRGELGEVRMYNYALTGSEVTDLYDSTKATYPNAPITEQLLIWYRADTYSGSGAWTNSGTLGTTHNAVVNSGTPSKNGPGVVFNGGLTYRFPTTGPLPNFTVSVWFMRTGNSRTIVAQQYHWSQNVGLYIGNNNARLFYGRFRTGQVDYGGGGIDTDINVWYHMVITFDGSRMISYLNGRDVDNVRVTGFVEVTDNQFFLGGNWDGGAEFVGRIGDFRIYNRALSEAAVQNLYSSTLSPYLTPTTPVTPTTNMLVRFNASSYSGTGSWTNLGTLGATHNATVHGTPVKNVAGNGIVFNSNLQYRFPSVGALTNYTISVWIKRTGLARVIMSQINNNTSNFIGVITTNGSRNFGSQFFRNNVWYGGGWVESSINTWENLTFVWSGTQMLSYLNGNLYNIANISGVTSQESGQTYIIGGDWNWSSTFIGEIGEVRLYSGALNDSMVQDIYTSTVGDYPNNVVPTTELLVHYQASSYSGTGAWTNAGVLGSTHNATVHGTPSKNTAGNGVVFNANLQYRFPSVGALPSYTQSFWIKRTGLASTLIAQAAGSSNFTGIVSPNGARGFYGRFQFDGWWRDGPTVETELNRWHMLTVVWTGNEMRMYLDGTLRSISYMAGVHSEQNGNLFILGGDWDFWNRFVGELGEFRFYNGPLTASEISQLYTTSVNSYPNNVVPTTELLVHYQASSYSGTGAWTNAGVLGSTHNGAVFGTPSKNTAGNGVVFNANLQYRFPSIGSLASYTQSFWIKRTGLANTLIAQVNGNSNFTGIVSPNGARGFYPRFQFNGWWRDGPTVETELGIWHMLTFVWSGTQMLVYLDGSLQSISNMFGVFSEQNGNQFILGGDWDYWNRFVGELGEFRFYNGVLSSSSIAQLYNSSVANYPNPSVPTQMPVRFVASTYTTLTSPWPNSGDLGSTHNATAFGTVVKNQAGNGIVFNENLQFRYPSFGSMKQYTQMVWIKRTGLARTIMAQASGSNNFSNIIEGSFRSFFSRFQFSGWWRDGGSLETDPDTWYLLTYVWTGTHMFNYLNGGLVSITNMTGVHSEQNNNQHIIGGQWDYWNTFVGEIGEIRVYNGVVGESTIAEIYNTTAPLYPNVVVNQLRIHYTATNYSGSGAWPNSGTLGTAFNATIGTGTPSKSGNGIVFNGGLRYNIPNFGSMARYTQAIWIRRTNNAVNMIMSQQNRGWGYMAGAIFGNGSTGIYGSFQNNWWYNGTTANLPNLNTWYHFAVTWNGTHMLTYLNGTIIGITNMTGVHSEQNGLQYFLGANWDGTPTFTGHLGELRIYNYVLTGTEISELYASTAATFA